MGEPTRPDASGDDSLAAGDRLGRFELVARIGEGGMGRVFRAHDPELHRHVAVKVLRPEIVAGPLTGEAARGRLRREAQAMARVAHPNVIAVHEVGTEDDHVFIVMELVDGGTLRAWLEARARSVDEILELFAQAGRGLAAAHDAGLVHRDFKPENVLVGADGRARVTDFGLVGAASGDVDVERSTLAGPLALALTHEGAVLGTPSYMSPEQHLGENATSASDQFSFCVALYEALWKVRPFAGPSYRALVSAVTEGAPRTPPADPPVPDAVRAVILRGLARDPAQRFASMSALLAALDDARRTPRRRARWPLFAAAAVISAAAIAWLAWPRGADHGAPAPTTIAAPPPDAGVAPVAAPVALTAMGGCVEHPIFLDDDTIVFDRSFGPSQDLFSLPTLGGMPKRLTSGPDFHWNVRPGPGPGELTYIRKEHGTNISYAARMSGGVARDLPTPEKWDVGVGIVPVGNGIAYATPDVRQIRVLADGVDRALVTMPPDREINQISTSRDGRWLAIDTTLTHGECLVDLTAPTPSLDCRTTKGSKNNTWFDATGDHFYHSVNNGVLRYDRATGKTEEVARRVDVGGEIAVTSDDRTLVYSDCTVRARLLDVHGKTPVELIAGRISSPAVGPGDRIVFVQKGVDHPTLVIRNPDGTTREITDKGTASVEPAFDPDGTHVVFRAVAKGLFVVDTTPYAPQPLTDDPADRLPRFLDADRVVFNRNDADQRPFVWIVPVRGGAPTRAIDRPRTLIDVDRKTGRVLVADVDDVHVFWWDPKTGAERPFDAMIALTKRRQLAVHNAAIALDGSAVYVNDLDLKVWRVPIDGGAPSVAYTVSLDSYDDVDRLVPLSTGLVVAADFWAGELYRLDLPPR